jgi:rubrerythrin
MDKDKVLSQLKSLVHLDIDAVRAYTSAIDHIDLSDVKEKLVLFRTDHERHIADLSALIREYGEEPPKQTPDLMGYFIHGFTAIRSMTGTEGALKAMKSNEELSNKKYAAALELDLPSEVRDVVELNRDDERRHLEYVEKCIDSKVWEQKKAA